MGVTIKQARSLAKKHWNALADAWNQWDALGADEKEELIRQEMCCKNPDHDMYPWYGVAPHCHDLSKGTFMGSTRVRPKDSWPKSFVEDPECEGCGTYYCPDCWERNHEQHPDVLPSRSDPKARPG